MNLKLASIPLQVLKLKRNLHLLVVEIQTMAIDLLPAQLSSLRIPEMRVIRCHQ
jgi:hypothetical protein